MNQATSTATDAVLASETITGAVLASMEKSGNERLRTVMTSLIRHLHDLAREVRLTPEELFLADKFLIDCGLMCSESRHEFLLLFDTIGLTMVVDTVTADLPAHATPTSVLGPFYRQDAPVFPHGSDISQGPIDGEPIHVSGRITDTEGQPVKDAVVDVWSTNKEGFYENIDPNQPDMNLRGRFVSDQDGLFNFRSVKPVSYPVPDDGPAGRLLYALERHNMRPAHIHFIVSAPGYSTIITELFTRDDPFIDSDAVFGVKESLLVDYQPATDAERQNDPDLRWTLDLDFVLGQGEGTVVEFSTGRDANA